MIKKSLNKLTNYTTEKIFQRLLNNKSRKNYWQYVSELRKRKTDEIFDISCSLIRSNKTKERVIGADILSQFGFPRRYKKEIIKLFFNLLQFETEIEVLFSILYGISHNNENLTKKQVKFLSTFKNHKSVKVRFSLVSSLSTIENDLAIKTLIELSNDKDSDIRNWSTFGIGSLIDIDNINIRNALWNRVLDKDETTKFEAISGLALRKDNRIKEVLITELKNIDNNGGLILESIEQLGDKSFISNLEKQIQLNKKFKKVNEDWLIETLNKLKGIK